MRAQRMSTVGVLLLPSGARQRTAHLAKRLAFTARSGCMVSVTTPVSLYRSRRSRRMARYATSAQNSCTGGAATMPAQ